MSALPTIVILAAGNSSRLGQPKQLVPFKKQTLLSYTIQEAKAAGLGEVVVVLGSGAEQLRKKIQDAQVILNSNWQKGMGSSIAAGVEHLMSEGAEAAVFLLCDQPFISAVLIKELAAAGAQSGIAICDYGVGQGPPSYFSNRFFSELRLLTGDSGAKPVIKNYAEQVSYVSFVEGRHDIDTIDDLKMLEQ